MKKIGLTGGIGSGKSFISGILQKMGYPVFFSDDFAKSIYDVDVEVKAALIQLFGEGLYVDSKLDRVALAKLIFENDRHRLNVNAIVHPKVRQAFSDWAAKQDASIVFNEAAILFETNGHRSLDATVLVTAPVQLRVKRVMQRDYSSEQEILARMNKQWTDELKEPLANFIIVNDDVQPVLTQVEEMIDYFTK